MLERLQRYSKGLLSLSSKVDNLHYEKFPDSTVKCIEDEIPFELPQGWEWTRLQTICEPITDGTHKTPTYSKEGYIFLSSKNVTSGRIDWENIMYIPESLHNELHARLAPQRNDILLAKNGTTGVAAIVDKDCVFDIYVSLALLRIVGYIISSEYLLSIIASSIVQNYFNSSLKGIGVPNLHLEHIRTSLLPIAPIYEQPRIVAKITKMLYFVDTIETNKSDLQSTIQQTKSKILDLAIKGKLVPQDPNDEPASILLERIRAEKEELIRQGKIKRDKKESVIYKGDDNSYYEVIGSKTISIDNEIPFDLPNGWEWARLGHIGEWKAGATPNRKCLEYYSNGNIPWVKTGDLNDNYVIEIPEKITKKALEETSVSLIPKDTILIAMYGATIGKLGITTCEVTTNQACCACCNLKGVNKSFLFYFLMQYKSNFISMGFGGAQPNISKEKIIQVLIPIPPFEEQKRIANKVSQLFSLLDSIAENMD